jgi:hypothetical protein
VRRRGRLGRGPGGGNGLHHARHAGSLGPGRGFPSIARIGSACDFEGSPGVEGFP